MEKMRSSAGHNRVGKRVGLMWGRMRDGFECTGAGKSSRDWQRASIRQQTSPPGATSRTAPSQQTSSSCKRTVDAVRVARSVDGGGEAVADRGRGVQGAQVVGDGDGGGGGRGAAPLLDQRTAAVGHLHVMGWGGG